MFIYWKKMLQWKKLLCILYVPVFVKLSGECQSVDELSYPLPFDAYIWNWVGRSAGSLCCFIKHDDLAVMLWPHSVILVKKRFSKVPCCHQWALWKISKCLSHCSSTQRKKCLYYFLSALISSLSEKAQLPLVLLATYLLLSLFTWVRASTGIQKKTCSPVCSTYSPSGSLQSLLHQGLFCWHFLFLIGG